MTSLPPRFDAAAAEPLARFNDTTDTLSLLRTRRSTTVAQMTQAGPDDEDLAAILAAGARVPDHGKLAPWRFVVFRGEARAAFGRVLEERFRALNPDRSEETYAFERGRFLRAPVVIAVVSRAAPHPKIPEWEQQLSAGASCMTMLIAATAMGHAAQWITEWCAYDRAVAREMGLAEHERVAGFIYVGGRGEELIERDRPRLDDIVGEYRADRR